MRSILFVCILSLAMLACSLLGAPSPDSVAEPTKLSPPTAAPTKAPALPTNTPAPTAIPTSEPLVLTDEAFEANIKDTCSTEVPILGYDGGAFSIGGGTISFRNGELALWCYGARHQWIGTIEYEGFTFASDENDPMQFEIVENVGYQFVGGIGKLTYPDGTEVDLYRPTKTQGQPSAPGSQAESFFRDDFTNSLQAGWEWQNENPSRWEITSQGWLKITGEDDSLLANGSQSNLLCREAPKGDFQVTVHVQADPSDDFQQATLYLFQNGNDFVAINRGYCGPCDTGGDGIFMEYKRGGKWESYNVATQDPDVFLRLVSQRNTITGQYALEAGEWQTLGEVSNQLGNPKICLGVSNVDSAGINADLVGEFDYIEISEP